MEKKNYKLLAACDGSDLALDAVRYIGKTFPPDRTEVVLFYVDTKIPRSFWNMERQMDFKFQPCNIRASMANQFKTINDFMDSARQILFKSGFSEDSVAKKIHAKRQGIVRDIIDESLQGYDALILGRKGRSRVKDILFGSVPERLLGKIRNIPLIIVGGVPVHKNVLIAFDGSRIIRRAVKCIGSMIEDYDSRFLLCHALKSPGLFNRETENPGAETNSVTEYNLFEDSKAFLRNAGFPVSQVSCEIIDAPKNFSENIIEKAKQGNYGTIVIGRRDLSRIKQFFTGRVGDKIFQLADNLIIWVIQ